MKNFLQRLIDTKIHAEEIVRPRPRSLYELQMLYNAPAESGPDPGTGLQETGKFMPAGSTPLEDGMSFAGRDLTGSAGTAASGSTKGLARVVDHNPPFEPEPAHDGLMAVPQAGGSTPVPLQLQDQREQRSGTARASAVTVIPAVAGTPGQELHAVRRTTGKGELRIRHSETMSLHSTVPGPYVAFEENGVSAGKDRAPASGLAESIAEQPGARGIQNGSARVSTGSQKIAGKAPEQTGPGPDRTMDSPLLDSPPRPAYRTLSTHNRNDAIPAVSGLNGTVSYRDYKPTVIRVSIGRIEVKAETPQPAVMPVPERLPVPRLTLDEYLRMRRGDAS